MEKIKNKGSIKSSGLHFLLGSLILILISIFVFRLAFSSTFDNVITDTTYFEYNSADNQINNLDDINVTTKGFLNFYRQLHNIFGECVENLNKFNVFQAVADSTSDIPLIGRFLNFMSQVYTILVYLVSMILTPIEYFLALLQYVFTLEEVEIIYTTVSIPNVG